MSDIFNVKMLFTAKITPKNFGLPACHFLGWEGVKKKLYLEAQIKKNQKKGTSFVYITNKCKSNISLTT